MEDRKMREGERASESEKERGPEIGSGSGVSALGTHTSGGDMTRHAGSTQLGQRSALPCCFDLASPALTNTDTRGHARTHTVAQTDKQIQSPTARSLIRTLPVSDLDTHSFADKHTLAHTQNAMVLARTGRAGEGPGLMETPNSLL